MPPSTVPPPEPMVPPVAPAPPAPALPPVAPAPPVLSLPPEPAVPPVAPAPPEPDVPPVACMPPVLSLPPLPLTPALPPTPPSPSSLSPPQAVRAVAPAIVAPNANVAARPRRVRGRRGSGLPERSTCAAQNGHAASSRRMCRLQLGQGNKGAIRSSGRGGLAKTLTSGDRSRLRGLDQQLESSVIEWLSRGNAHPNHTLALSARVVLERAVMTVRDISGLAEQDARRPGAASAADVGVVAAPTVGPQLIDGAIPRVPQRRAALPDLAERMISNVSADPGVRRQRRAALDAAVGLDAERRATGAARSHVPARHGALQHALIGAEVSDVVARPKFDAELDRASLQFSEHRKELQQIVRLEQHVRLVSAAPHGHRQLDLPAVRSGRADQLQDLRQLRQAQAVDLSVRGDPLPRFAQVPQRRE